MEKSVTHATNMARAAAPPLARFGLCLCPTGHLSATRPDFLILKPDPKRSDDSTVEWLNKLGIKREALLPAFLAVLVAISIVASSTVFAQGDQTQRALAHAADAQWAEELLTATTAVRASSAVVLLIADAKESGRATTDELGAALEDLREIRRQMVERAAALGARLVSPSALAEADVLAGHIDKLSELIVAADLDGAEALAQGPLLESLDSLESQAIVIRDDALTRVTAEAGTAGALARAASIAVALIVPAMALIAFRWVQRRRQQQRELELKLEYQLARARVKDEMVANLSHELRTPLTGIYGMALAMADEGFADHDLSQELIEIIVGEAADLSRMVDDLLATAKVDAGDISIVHENVDPASLVDEVVAPFARTRHIAVDCAPVRVVADSLRLKQVVRNILSNALKHGGPRVGVLGQARGDRYVLAIFDDGPGVPEGLQTRLFDRFIHDGATPLTRGSVGLGLSIAYELVKRMDGSLTYRRISDRTTFLIELPLAAAPAAVLTATG